MKKLLLFFSAFLICTSAYAKPHENTWYPDTCNGCAVTYTFDDELPAEQRVISFKRIEKDDDAHKDKTPQKQFDAILEENQRKNKAIKSIMDADPTLTETKDGTVQLKQDVKIEYSYDKDRLLHLKVNNEDIAEPVTQEVKVELQTAVTSDIGEGKVSVE